MEPAPTDTQKLNLNDLAAQIVSISRGNGWDVATPYDWKEEPNVDKLLRLHALIHTEIAEATEAVRHNDIENFVEECADIIIRVLDMTGGLGLDIQEALDKKLIKNVSRGHRHGGKLA